MLQSKDICNLIKYCDIERKNKYTTIVFSIAVCLFIGLQIFNYINPCSKNGSLDSWVLKFISEGEIFILLAFIIENFCKLWIWNNSQIFKIGLNIYLPIICINIFMLLSIIQQNFQVTYYCENIYG